MLSGIYYNGGQNPGLALRIRKRNMATGMNQSAFNQRLLGRLPYVLGVIRIVVGALFLEHGLSTSLGLLGGRADWNFAKLHAWAGPIELIGGTLLMLGLCTRFTAFILSGEMAVAYFQSPLRRTGSPGIIFLALPNGGEEAALDSFFFLWLMTAGGGPWSLDGLLEKRRQKKPEAAVSGIGQPLRT
jgi:putative oxidoreductase